MLARVGFRHRWRGLALLAIITAATCGFVLTAATGARRVHTSWARLQSATLSPQAGVSVSPKEVDAVRAALAARPDVAAAGAFNWMPASAKGMPGADQYGVFAGLGPGFGTTVWRPIVDRGRLANPARADEITVNQAYADLADIQVGDRVELTGPTGIDQRATVVGIHRSPLDLGPNGGEPSAYGTPAFMARWWPGVASLPDAEGFRPLIALRFRSGADARATRRALAASLPRDAGILGTADLGADALAGLNAASTSYLVLGVASAIGSVLLLSFLVGRAIRERGGDAGILAALGATRVIRAFAIWAPLATAVAAGLIAAPLLAVFTSPLVRTGLAAQADPVRGIWVDRILLVEVSAALAVALFTAAGASARRVAGLAHDTDAASIRVSPLARLGRASPAAGIGVRAAVGGADVATRRLARSTLAALTGALTCLIASSVWVSSGNRLAQR